jgi:hypothetical protein
MAAGAQGNNEAQECAAEGFSPPGGRERAGSGGTLSQTVHSHAHGRGPADHEKRPPEDGAHNAQRVLSLTPPQWTTPSLTGQTPGRHVD